MRGQRTNSSGGLSLIELVLVLTIVSVLAVMAVPRYGRALSRYQLDMAARRLSQDLCLAREQARVTGQQRTVQFLVASSQYLLTDVSHPDRPEQAYCVSLADEPCWTQIVLVDFGGGTEAAFNGFGLPAVGGQVVLDRNGARKTVVLDGETGEVTIP